MGDANTQTPEFKAFLVNVEKDLSELMPHTHKPGEEHEHQHRHGEDEDSRATQKTSLLMRLLKGTTEV